MFFDAVGFHIHLVYRVWPLTSQFSSPQTSKPIRSLLLAELLRPKVLLMCLLNMAPKAPYENQNGHFMSANTNSPEFETNTISFEPAGENDVVDPIAIVGFSLKFPQGAESPDSFWSMMVEGKCAATEFPEDRLSTTVRYHPDSNRKDTFAVRGGHFLKDNIGGFDAPFFSISATEAAALDPQQRGLLETTYRALENSGLPMPKVFGSKTSVYTGCFTNDWQQLCYKDSENSQSYMGLGIAPCMNANRINWFFNFTGGSANVDTACSSSLVALHLACNDLINDDAEMVYFIHVLSNMKMLSPDYRCFSFDDRANGYSRGEGFGVLILKRLSDAVRDGDTIRAVIRATGSNQDGHTPGIMQPSRISQEVLIKHTYHKARLSMEETRYIEAHGTGTAVGDPLEAAAFGSAFRASRTPNDPLYVGAVKSNIGHLEGASGIAGVIKAIMILEKAMIPRNTNFENLNPRIDAEFLHIKFPLQTIPWPKAGLRRASVNSFGFGGTNAHVILDDAYHFLQQRGLVANHNTVKNPPTLLNNDDYSKNQVNSLNGVGQDDQLKRPKIYVFSAYDSAALKRTTAQFTDYFIGLDLSREKLPKFLSDLAYTLATKRSMLSWRSFLIADSLQNLKELDTAASSPLQSLDEMKLGFNEASTIFKRLALRGSFSAKELFRNTQDSNINNPKFSQPICTATQIALVDLLRSFGVQPTAVVGHSSGEIAAAYCIGALSFNSALKAAYYRGACAAKLALGVGPKGAMMSVGLSEEKARAYLTAYKCVKVACINSNKNVTLSGDETQILELQQIFNEERIFARKLLIDVAYHSHHMEAIASEYEQAIQELSPGNQTPQNCTMISSVTGERVGKDQLCQPEYWVRNMVSPVRFYNAIQKICDQSARKGRKKLDCSHRHQLCVDMLVEVGPHSALQGPIQEMFNSISSQNIRYSSMLARNRSALQTVLSTVGHIHCLGYPVSLEAVNNSETDAHQKMLTNLPEYPFDHSQEYWYETRLSKRNRFHPQGKLDLLGKPVTDWNPVEAKWRNFIRLSDMPWVGHHVINGTLIYPAAGMLVMAIEAANQISDINREVSGFQFKDVLFQKPLVIPQNDEGIQTYFYVRQIPKNSEYDESCSEFRLCSCDDEQWTEHCHGYVKTEYLSDTATITFAKEKQAQIEHELAVYKDTLLSCEGTIDAQKLYPALNKGGFGFGTSFQRLRDVRYSSEAKATARVELYQWPEDQFPQPHIVHPTSLDGMLHLCLAALAQGCEDSTAISTSVPSLIRRMWIANSGLAFPTSRHVAATAIATELDNRGVEFNISVLNEWLDRPVMRTEGLRMTIVADSASTQAEIHEKRPCYLFEYQPDIDLLESSELKAYCASEEYSAPEPRKFYQELLFCQYVFLAKALEGLRDGDPKLPHLQKFVGWARRCVDNYDKGELPHSQSGWKTLKTDETYVEAAFSRVESASGQGRVFITTGRNLLSILRGEIDPLEFLFKSDLLRDLYRDINDNRPCFPAFDRYLHALSHKNPNLKVLEVGAGTGGTSSKILHALSVDENGQPGISRYASYTYTDISSFFFEAAQNDFGHYPRLIFRPLNIETDPTEQGYEAHSYDLIVAANVLHATTDINNTIRNVHKLLKPGGKLMMYEIARPDILRTGFVAGLLPGWWLSTDSFREWAPSLSSEMWNKILQDQNFSGIDLELEEFASSECQETNSDIQGRASQDLQAIYRDDELTNCNIVTMDEMHELQNSTWDKVIFLLELERPILLDLTTENYSKLQHILTSSKDIVWVSSGGGATTKNSAYGMIDGFSRALRNENVDVPLTVIALEIQGSGIDTYQLQKIRQISLRLDDQVYEPEYLQIGDVFMIPRVKPCSHLTEDIHQRSLPQQASTQEVGESPPVKLAIGSLGLLETLHFIEDKETALPLAPDEVEVEVKVIGLSLKDCQKAFGRIPGTEFGNDFSGVVTRMGSCCEGFTKGDYVVTSSSENFKSFARAKVDVLCRIPKGVSFTEAASIPMPFLTAWQTVRVIGRTQERETLLIYDGASAIGQAVIQVAKYHRAEVYATFTSDEHMRVLTEKYGLQEDHIIYSEGSSFTKAIMRATKGRGVDIIISSQTGDDLSTALECVAPYGRCISIGQAGSSGLTRLSTFAKNSSFTSFDTLSWIKDQPLRAKQALQEVLDLFANGVLQTVSPLHVHGLQDTEKAFRSIQNSKSIGQFVMEIQPEAQISTLLDTKSTAVLDSNGTYIIAGGFGGLGKTIARWMMEHGAKNIILVSRSGPKTEADTALLEEFRSNGVNVEAPACDIVDSDSLREVLSKCSKILPPVKGCVQATMVLKDSSFKQMSHGDWNQGTQCKTLGSWNLHTHLPTNLDFFIMLSSASGIVGIHGQTNYGAGNTYMDSLARYRVSRGQKAVSLDLGAMVEDGMLVGDADFMNRVMSYGTFSSINRNQTFALLDYYCDSSLPLLTPRESQIIFGLGMGEAVTRQKLFAHTIQNESDLNTGEGDHGKTTNFTKLFAESESMAEAGTIAAQALIKKLSRTLSTLQDDVDLGKPLHIYGVDSLLAVDLKSWIGKEFGADVPVFEFQGGATFNSVGMLIASRSKMAHKAWEM
ncbi:hypothetical protein G7Y89_g9483 [Cudoniella acicularis]|uniref:Carrier domain-containing protein n=1 Tax=Cudoniella acicularis TaxID=354080 RepID=A0A8H4RGS5_9HELO|nr:hypothetical protein G7Y89_g9483 [Cudoniella acicularis]